MKYSSGRVEVQEGLAGPPVLTSKLLARPWCWKARVELVSAVQLSRLASGHLAWVVGSSLGLNVSTAIGVGAPQAGDSAEAIGGRKGLCG